MSFKEYIEIDKIKPITDDIYQSVEAIIEFGHCAVASSEKEKYKERSKLLRQKLEECRAELDQLCDEMKDWYSY